MDKTFEVDLIRLESDGVDETIVAIKAADERISFVISSGIVTSGFLLFPSEAVTIGEQLIAAGKAEG